MSKQHVDKNHPNMRDFTSKIKYTVEMDFMKKYNFLDRDDSESSQTYNQGFQRNLFAKKKFNLFEISPTTFKII